MIAKCRPEREHQSAQHERDAANPAAEALRARLAVLSPTVLEIHDDGLGFDPAKVHVAIGHGVSNMQLRARNAGGDVEIFSEPGQGTTITTWVPFREPNPG